MGRNRPVGLLPAGHRLGAGASGLAANVDPIHPVCNHLAGIYNRPETVWKRPPSLKLSGVNSQRPSTAAASSDGKPFVELLGCHRLFASRK